MGVSFAEVVASTPLPCDTMRASMSDVTSKFEARRVQNVPGSIHAIGCTMAEKQKGTSETKKPGKTLKEKRAAKSDKQAAQKAARKGRE